MYSKKVINRNKKLNEKEKLDEKDIIKDKLINESKNYYKNNINIFFNGLSLLTVNSIEIGRIVN